MKVPRQGMPDKFKEASVAKKLKLEEGSGIGGQRGDGEAGFVGYYKGFGFHFEQNGEKKNSASDVIYLTFRKNLFGSNVERFQNNQVRAAGLVRRMLK